MKKHDRDNRSRQLNPQDPTYWRSRHEPPPSPAGTPAPDPAPTTPPPVKEANKR
ncbi:MAG: hypothetical protein H6697_09285 [Myxococcales bacterium]|nr:hypothetical protein [Myxococcales bacterium]